jgi:D-inositol-3-phosphate glycosyltransferase
VRLLVLGQGAQYSGYARVLRTLALLLASDFEVYYFALNCRPVPCVPGVTSIEPTLRSDPYGLSELPRVLSRVEPHVVLACHDPEVLAAQARIVRTHRSAARIVLYLPLEWEPQDPAMLRELADADRLVCYTSTARRWLLAQLGPIRSIAAAPIPHGVDRHVFGPLGADGTSDRRAARSTARSAARRLLALSDEHTVILNANRDSPRKRLDLALRAFALIADQVPDARLILTHGQRLRHDARRPPLLGRVLIPDDPPATDRVLNHYYNCADIGLNTCTAEGWGMVAMEHAAAGVGQIMPEHPALREIWEYGAAFVPYPSSGIDGFGVADPVDVAKSLLSLCQTPERADRLGREARDRADSAEFDWPGIARRWSALLRDAVSEDR